MPRNGWSSDSVEHLKVIANETWRKPLEGEYDSKTDETVPCTVIYTRKRDGRYK